MTGVSKDSFLRETVGKCMVQLGALDKRVVIVNADLMNTCRTDQFDKKYPDRSFNVGIAEQNMAGFAAGLAHEGYMPFVFSMAPFISMRACEQCRTDIAYEALNVRMMAVYSGVSGGISGATHWGIEDCGIMCSIPDMTVVDLSDAVQAECLLHASLHYRGPVYFRISIESVSKIYSENCTFEFGKASIPRNRDDGAFLCAGVTVSYALKAAERIRKKCGADIRVTDMHTVKPIDQEAVIQAARTGAVVAAQDHNVIGVMGQYAANIIAAHGISAVFINAGIPDRFDAMAHAPYLYHKYGYDVQGLENAMMYALSRKR